MSKIVDWSPTALGSSASHSLGTLKAKSSNLDLTSMGEPVARDLNGFLKCQVNPTRPHQGSPHCVVFDI